MVEYNKVNLRLSNSQSKKMKDAVKKRKENGTTLKIGNKNFDKDQLLHEFFLT